MMTDNADVPLSKGQVILWWELRRVPYNLVLLLIGLLAILGMEWLMGAVLPTGDDAVEPAFLTLGAFAYGIMANVFYTLGWIIELLGARRDAGFARRQSEQLFRLGILFSCLLTTAPFCFGCLFWLLHRVGVR